MVIMNGQPGVLAILADPFHATLVPWPGLLLSVWPIFVIVFANLLFLAVAITRSSIPDWILVRWGFLSSLLCFPRRWSVQQCRRVPIWPSKVLEVFGRSKCSPALLVPNDDAVFFVTFSFLFAFFSVEED